MHGQQNIKICRFTPWFLKKVTWIALCNGLRIFEYVVRWNGRDLASLGNGVESAMSWIIYKQEYTASLSLYNKK